MHLLFWFSFFLMRVHIWWTIFLMRVHIWWTIFLMRAHIWWTIFLWASFEGVWHELSGGIYLCRAQLNVHFQKEFHLWSWVGLPGEKYAPKYLIPLTSLSFYWSLMFYFADGSENFNETKSFVASTPLLWHLERVSNTLNCLMCATFVLLLTVMRRGRRSSNAATLSTIWKFRCFGNVTKETDWRLLMTTRSLRQQFFSFSWFELNIFWSLFPPKTMSKTNSGVFQNNLANRRWNWIRALCA